jgi:hypothetical protein
MREKQWLCCVNVFSKLLGSFNISGNSFFTFMQILSVRLAIEFILLSLTTTLDDLCWFENRFLSEIIGIRQEQ